MKITAIEIIRRKRIAWLDNKPKDGENILFFGVVRAEPLYPSYGILAERRSSIIKKNLERRKLLS